MSLKALVDVMNAKYALDPGYAFQLAAVIHQVRAGKLPFEKETFNLEASRPFVYEAVNASNPEKKGKVSVITIEGPIFRADQVCGPMGSMTLSSYLKSFDQDPSISAHVIKMHTPGGEVAGIETFADVIANTEKPVIIWGEHIFSGGVYLAAGASYIMLSGKNAQIGSVGVQVSYLNFKKHLDKKGIEHVLIRATTSPKKNKYDFFNLTEEDKEAFAKEELDPIDKNFMDHVRAHRTQVQDEALTGDIFFPERAIELGLADGTGTFEEAIALALEMSGVFTENKSTNMNNNNSSAAEDSPAVVSVNNADLTEKVASQKIALEEKDAAIAGHLEAISVLQAHNSALSENKIEQETKIQALETKVEELSQLPGAETGVEEAAPTADAADLVSESSDEQSEVPASVSLAIERGKMRRKHTEQNNKN